MEKDKKSEIHITNNFNAPIGQHIDHVDTINFRMDGEGKFEFGIVENVDKGTEPSKEKHDEDLFHFVHPEIEDEDALKIHNAVKRLVVTQTIPDICLYLKEQKQKGKVLLPSNPANIYNELVRMGMPTGEGFSEKHFTNTYKKLVISY